MDRSDSILQGDLTGSKVTPVPFVISILVPLGKNGHLRTLLWTVNNAEVFKSNFFNLLEESMFDTYLIPIHLHDRNGKEWPR